MEYEFKQLNVTRDSISLLIFIPNCTLKLILTLFLLISFFPQPLLQSIGKLPQVAAWT